jgi:hypothetical protein
MDVQGTNCKFSTTYCDFEPPLLKIAVSNILMVENCGIPQKKLQKIAEKMRKLREKLWKIEEKLWKIAEIAENCGNCEKKIVEKLRKNCGPQFTPIQSTGNRHRKIAV